MTSNLRSVPDSGADFENTYRAIQSVCILAMPVVIQLYATDRRAATGVCAASTVFTSLYEITKTIPANVTDDFRRRLRSILFYVEQICYWPEPSPSSTTTLSVLDAIILPETNQLRRQAVSRVQKGVSSFAASPEDEILPYIKKFRKFANRLSPSNGEHRKLFESAIIHPSADVDDYPDEVNITLHKVLDRHSRCTCEAPQGSSERHHARLQLRRPLKKQDKHFAFDLLLSSMHTSFGHWQDVELQVATHKNNSSVHFPGDNSDYQLQERSSELGPGYFCDLLKSELASRVCLRAQKSTLYELSSLGVLQNVRPGPSIPLRKIFQSYRLPSKTKLILCYIVARSVWQFYDTPWMASRWSSDTIHFFPNLPEHSMYFTKDGHACKPYYSINFNQPDQILEEYCECPSVIFRYPRLLDLCITLLELGTGRGLELATDDSIPARMNKNWQIAKALIQNSSCWRYEDFEYADFKEAIDKCLDSGVFEPTIRYEGDPQCLVHDIPKRRKILYDTVIAPLRSLLGVYQSLDTIDDMIPVFDIRPEQAPRVLPPQQTGHIPNTTKVDGYDRDTGESTEWIRCLQEINRKMRSEYQDVYESAHPIRVAILDTGYDQDTPFFQDMPRRRQVKGWKDLYEKQTSAVDECGHGTHTLALAMKVAPGAHFYVARITRDTEGMKNAPKAICEAIKWASEDCEADIISMSLGFAKENQEISNAIYNAVRIRSGRILFFAAASNSGGNDVEWFPACHSSVISIRQTNAKGEFSDNNPPVNMDGPVVYGTLGQNVPSAWLSNVIGEITKSGTSVATAIAAGIAAMMLLFATIQRRHSTCSPLGVDKLRTQDGMVALFAKMSQDMGNRTRFLSPLYFFKKGGNFQGCWRLMNET
ncbi:subtilisin-like protein [Annulohypoxylon truncatum]|uniref:subtilisin-like protein n=1 Tax=Annulohypoxylon truncatum TaxID=327061 RepID=UPI00200794EA|nr:subtilisin-like protein [Annulohypoxylon truncatum]KAI1214234.1 subtilisin-like protein [Annulohypoxylon truncatum]